MLRARIYEIGETQLPDTIEPLEIWMLDQIINELGWNRDESIHRIINDFTLVQEEKILIALRNIVKDMIVQYHGNNNVSDAPNHYKQNYPKPAPKRFFRLFRIPTPQFDHYQIGL